MSSNFDWEWIGNIWEERERKKMQETFEHFHKSKEWGMIFMIYEAGDCFEIVIRVVREKRSYISGRGWKKSYLTPEQLKSVQEKKQELEQKKEALPAEQSKKNYEWAIFRQGLEFLPMTGTITACSPEEAERILRGGERCWNTGITVFY